MRHSVRLRLDTLIRVREFGITHAASFPPGSRGQELFSGLSDTVGRLQAHTTEHDSGKRESRQISLSKSVTRDSLVAQLEAINRTSRVVALTSPGLEAKFRMPLAFPAQDLLSAARSFLANATPLKADFVRQELPEDFLDELSATIGDFERAINQFHRAKGAKVSSHTAQDEDIGEGMSLLHQLDVVMKNKFSSDRAMLTEWTSASHVERQSPKGPKPGGAPAPPAQAPPPSA